MGKRTISFGLNEKDLNRAIRELEEYRKEFLRKCNELIRQLTEHGEEIAKLEVVQLGAFDTGNLHDSIHGYFDPESRVGFIRAECWYAVYVEYGTGIVGARNPHPLSGDHGWVYDINNHGENGWVYFSAHNGQCAFHHTRGQVSSPFMYNTFRILQQQAHNYAQTVFG